MNYEDGNKIIAEFMGRQIVSTPWPHKPVSEQGIWVQASYHPDFKEQLKYHSSWDLLMPVAKKICELGYTVQWTITDGATCRIWKYLENVPSCGVIVTDRPWTSIVQFITWYNQNKQS